MATPEVQNVSKAKETSDRLMSIIRTLSSGANVEQREKEKARLEREYKDSDKKLDVLVQEHQTDLTSIIQTFTQISTKITGSQEKIRAIKDNLQSCKNLLHCKRDELRKLWLEGIEHKTIVSMLDEIEQIKDVNGKLQMHIERKQYLHATDLLIKSVSLLESDLAEVEALRDVKIELRSKKEELYEILIEELHKQIYIKPMTSVIQGFQRQGSMRSSKGKSEKASMLKMALINASHTSTEIESVADENLRRMLDVKLEDVALPQQITEDIHVDPDNDSVHFLAVIIESLAVLKKMPEGIDNLRTQIRPGLLGIVQRASQQVYDNAFVEGENLANIYQPLMLLEILELVFQQFRVVARIHEIIIANMTRIKNSTTAFGDFCTYNSLEVWNKIQSVLTMLLGDYLDVRNTAATQSPSTMSFEEATTDIGAYFLKKRPAKTKKFSLFRFNASSHAISMDSYMREQRQEFYGTGEVLNGEGVEVSGKTEFVCKPCASNITMIYNPLQKFIKEVEKAIKAAPSTSTLANFTTLFIKETYLNLVLENIQNSINQATKGFDAQRVTIDLRTQRELGVPKPLLHVNILPQRIFCFSRIFCFKNTEISHEYMQTIQNMKYSKHQSEDSDDCFELFGKLNKSSDTLDIGVNSESTVSVARSIQELQNLMHDLPDYSDQFINMICQILQDYKDTCDNAYKGLVMSEMDEKRIISANWAKDEDIGRFLRSLPNWKNLKSDSEEQEEMSEEDLRAMNSKESSILTSNLSSTDALIPPQEVIYDVSQLKALGNLVESLEWFSNLIIDISKTLETQHQELHFHITDTAKKEHTPTLPAVSQNTLITLKSLSQDFQDLGDLCLLVLHLEVRVHCFFHLLPVPKQSNYSGAIDDMDPDSNVTKLNKDLSTIEEHLHQSLQPIKFRYIFEGLGHLVSTILINCTQYLRRINENGIKKMCRNIFAIQQSLTNITMSRESDLDHARQYYEMLYLKPDEILKLIIERGPQCTEQEYMNLLTLAHRSERGVSEKEQEKRILKLETILREYEGLV